MAAQQQKEPVGFIGLDDDADEHGLERAFGGFMRKGIGPDDRGGGNEAKSLTGISSGSKGSIWALEGGLD